MKIHFIEFVSDFSYYREVISNLEKRGYRVSGCSLLQWSSLNVVRSIMYFRED